MYCIKCGVELCEGEVRCPLCKTEVVHPDFMDKKKEPLYPEGVMPKKEKRIQLWAILMTALCFIALSVVVVCDVQFNHSLTWSVIVMGAMVLFYEIFVLPGWFSSPNPVIFVPCGFAAGILYLLYIDLLTKGSWFLSFGLPVAGGIAIIVCTVLTQMVSMLILRMLTPPHSSARPCGGNPAPTTACPINGAVLIRRRSFSFAWRKNHRFTLVIMHLIPR